MFPGPSISPVNTPVRRFNVGGDPTPIPEEHRGGRRRGLARVHHPGGIGNSGAGRAVPQDERTRIQMIPFGTSKIDNASADLSPLLPLRVAVDAFLGYSRDTTAPTGKPASFLF